MIRDMYEYPIFIKLVHFIQLDPDSDFLDTEYTQKYFDQLWVWDNPIYIS